MEMQNNPVANDNSLLVMQRQFPGLNPKAANASRWDINKKDFRSRIPTARLIRRLLKHALGEIEMNNSAVRAAIALLDRTIPTLQAIEVKGELTHRFCIEVPAVSLSAVHWEADTQSTQPPILDQQSTAQSKG